MSFFVMMSFFVHDVIFCHDVMIELHKRVEIYLHRCNHVFGKQIQKFIRVMSSENSYVDVDDFFQVKVLKFVHAQF